MISDAYLTIETANMKKALDFYKKLGFKIQCKSNYWSEIAGHGMWIGFYTGRKGKKSGKISIGFTVKDISKEIANLKKKGIKFSPVSTHEWGSTAYFEDPDGNDLYLYQNP